jgi:hypothetical protein
MVGLIVSEAGDHTRLPPLETCIPGVGTAGMAPPELTWGPAHYVHT